MLAAPLYMFGAISGFTFADRLVLEGVTAVIGPGSLTGYNSATQTLTVQQQAGPTLGYSLAGSAPGDLAAYDLNVNSQNGQTIISFVSPTAAPVAPSLAVPVALEGAAGVPVLVPNIVLNTPRPSPTGPAVSTLVTVTLSAASGTFSAGNDNGNTSVNGNNTGSIALSGTLDAVERSLQTLTYKAAAAGNTSIDSSSVTGPASRRRRRSRSSTTPPRCSSTGTTPTAAASAMSPTGPPRRTARPRAAPTSRRSAPAPIRCPATARWPRSWPRERRRSPGRSRRRAAAASR